MQSNAFTQNLIVQNVKKYRLASRTAKALFISSVLSASSYAQATINECDKLAAHYQNTENPNDVSGISFYEIVPDKAIEACTQAVKDYPNIARYKMQLGRSYNANEEYENAIDWFTRATKQESLISYSLLGNMYNSCSGPYDRSDKSVFWYEQAAQRGDSDAQYDTAVEYYHGGVGLEKSYKKAFYWFEKAAKQGNSDAQDYLGDMYDYGEGVDKSYEKAAYWYKKAAKKGDSDAQNSLGILYLDGHGVRQSDKKTAYWYKKSAKQGNEYAQNNLAALYEDGTGVKQSYRQAAYWYKLSAEQEYSVAQNNLGELYEKGLGVKQDYITAYALYKLAISDEKNDDYEYAITNLANLKTKMTKKQIAKADTHYPF